MTMRLEYVSVVIPVYNEQANLAQLLERCLKVAATFGCPYEIILVDDGSNDDSARIIGAAAREHRGAVVGVFLNRNYGQHAAVMAGFGQARGDVIVTLDADLQNPPEEIPVLLRAIADGHDAVGGVRRRRQDSVLRRSASRLMNAIMHRLTGVRVTDYGCMLRAYRRSVINEVLKCEERSTYIPALANSFASNIVEVDVDHAERNAGKSKYSFWKLLNLYFDLLIATTITPLRMLSVTGILLALAGVTFGVLLLVLRFVYGPEWAAQGVFTIFAVLFIFLGIQLIGMGLLGEYVGRISRDVRARPRFVIREIAGREAAAPADSRARAEASR
jgi:undecaprenyl-phosphate 4-deoxy-4-formamido-L-arabinose transferase